MFVSENFNADQAKLNQVHTVAAIILRALGEPCTPIQAMILQAFSAGDVEQVNYLAATNLHDNFCKSLAVLTEAFNLTNTNAILAESARAAAENVKDKTLRELNAKIEEALFLTFK